MDPSRHSDDTVDLPKVETDAELDAAADPNSKRCCQCGKDLRGHRRFKDSVGYWCKDCHRLDKARNKQPEGRCPDCGRMRPLDKLFQASDGTQVCSNCLKERQKELEKYAVKEAAEAEEKWQQRKPLYIMLGILILLGVIVVVQGVIRMMR